MYQALIIPAGLRTKSGLAALACKAGRRELLSHELEDKELKV